MRRLLIPFWLLSTLAAFNLGCERAAAPKPVSPPPTVQTDSTSKTDSSKEADMNKTASVTHKKLEPKVDGKQLEQIELTNKNGLRAVVLNWGGTLASVEVPDRNGKLDNIALGFAPANEKFLKNGPYVGVTCGRYGNRIAKGKFTLDGTEYTL
ncbi:MAG TPA: galactose-1-epimerase, partial [Planctomycetaceae bacterium]|nr:galactose-1-epimerase [Planctomycetaceae bacterium]